MSARKRTTRVSNTAFSGLIFVVLGVLTVAGCDLIGGDDNGEAEAQLEAVVMSPDSASFEAGEQVNFSVAVLTAEGDTARDANLSMRWWSSDTTVFSVTSDGLATGKASGTAYCMVEVKNAEAQAGKRPSDMLLPFTGRDSAFVHIF